MAPFAALIGLLALGPYLPAPLSYPLRMAAAVAATIVFSRKVLRLKPERWAASVGVGLAVFAVWIGPDLLLPGYRNHSIFHNALLGTATSGVPADLRTDWVLLAFRAGGSALVVPVAEELFWRAWLMRWLISPHLEKVPLGAWSARAFWITALLFASEHGAYWDVGLAAGLIYNGWMVRTRSLADCILAHAVTNACLAAWVLGAGQWQYWL